MKCHPRLAVLAVGCCNNRSQNPAPYYKLVPISFQVTATMTQLVFVCPKSSSAETEIV